MEETELRKDGYFVGKQKIIVPVAKGQVYTVPIHDLGNSGEGIGRVEGFTVFVPFALPEEVVKARITVVKKNYAVGEIEEIVMPSPHRIEPTCSVYGRCGGCQLQHVSYEEELRLKTEKVKNVMTRIGKIDASLVKPTLGPDEPWLYRNKMQVPVGRTKQGSMAEPMMGFYARGSHDIVPFETCQIQLEANNQLAKACRRIAVELGVAPYDEESGTGVLRHVIGRIGHRPDGEWMLILVTATKVLPKAEEWVARLRDQFPQLVSIVQNYNPAKTNVIMGPTNKVLWGEEYINDYIGDLAFRLSPHSFFQVNPVQIEVLYGKALEYANLTGSETVIDAYCGTGTISLFMARQAKRVIGLEIVEPAIRDAKKNAKHNGITNTEFMVGDATKVMPALYQKGERPDVIVVDPPRVGCTPEVLEAMAAMEPERIVYVSCNPATLARDIALLKELGYEAKEVQPVDMFPQTSHVEAVALLVK